MRGKINDLNGMQFFDTHDKVTFDTFLIRKLSMNNVHYFPNASYNHKQNVNGYLRKHSSLQTNLDSQLLFLFMSKGYHIKKNTYSHLVWNTKGLSHMYHGEPTYHSLGKASLRWHNNGLWTPWNVYVPWWNWSASRWYNDYF